MAPSHPDFKSVDSDVKDVDTLRDLYENFGLHAGRKFHRSEKLCPPFEHSEWDGDELENFEVDLAKVDRLYCCKKYTPYCQDTLDFYVRMDCKGRSLYAHVFLVLIDEFLRVTFIRKMYLTFDAQVFLKSVVDQECRPQEIWKSMVSDGLQVEEPSVFDLNCKSSWAGLGVPMLKFLCYLVVYENKTRLEFYTEVLPSNVVKGLQQFFKVRETRDDRDEKQHWNYY